MSLSDLRSLFGNHPSIIHAIASRTTFTQAEKECRFIETNHITPLLCTDSNYPSRLNLPDCSDTPPLLYSRGTCNLNSKRVVSIVGSRRMTDYGSQIVERIISALPPDVLVVSGLAYGVDTAAHTASLRHSLFTVSVVAHGLDRIYPPQNKNLALRILDSGGAILTEYPSNTAIHQSYFPARNRIIAALSDAVIVVEASTKGGALITAHIANSYHRDVYAVPGRLTDQYSLGCNNLIATQEAMIFNSTDDFLFNMGWQPANRTKIHQTQLPLLTADEQKVVNILSTQELLSIDELSSKTNFPSPQLAAIILNLELNGVIKCLPGKMYKLL